MHRHWTSILVVCVILLTLLGTVVEPGASAAQDGVASPESTVTSTDEGVSPVETEPLGTAEGDLPPGDLTFDAATETATAEPMPSEELEEAPTEGPALTETPVLTETPAPTATNEPTATAEAHVQETGLETQGALTLVAQTPWGTALANVCVQAVPSVGGAPAAEGCSETDGRVILTGLESGDYTVTAVTVPSGWQAFAPATETIAPGPTGELVVTLPFVSVGTLTFTGVDMYGPEIVPGGCVQVMTRDGGQPGNHVIAGPVCDEDGDGTAIIPAVPNMRLCIVVTPPEGFYRPSRDYAHCLDGFAGNGSFTLGFRKVRPTPTPVVDTPIPFPTSTPTPTRTPAPDEGNISLTVRNCVAVFSGDAEPTDYNGCQAAPAGVRLRVMQGAAEVGTFTTNANGAIAFDLPALTAYRLEYLDGNGADWVPSELEESRLRYGEASTFFFVPAPEVDDSWTMVVRIWKDINDPIPGGCAKIVDFQHPEITLLPELCDTDGDGEIVLGELPARPQTANYTRPTAYGAVITSLPIASGYAPLSSPYGGVEPNDLDFRWVSTPTVAFISVALHVTFIDAVTRAPVQGLCLDFDGGGLGSLVCDQGSGLIGTSLLRNSNYIAAVTNVPPGYLQPDALHLQTPQYPQGTPDNPSVHLIERTVELARDPNAATGSADVVIFLRRVTARGNNPFVGGAPVAEPVCLTISPVPQGTLATRCTTTRYGTVFFIDLPPGEYTFTADWSPTGTDWSCSTDPSPFGLTVGDDDLDKLLPRTFTWQCRYPAGEVGTCAVVDERVIRDVDIYMGTLRDPETGEVIATTVQFSEAISERFAFSLLDPEYWGHGDQNPAPDVLTWASVKPWTERGDEAWGLAGDWDGDARQRAIDDFERVLGGPVVFEEETEIAVSEIPGGIFSNVIFSPTQEESPFCYGPGKLVVITTLGLARVRFVEVSAIPAPPSPTPSPTPDGTSTPTPTATPEEEPICVAPRARMVDLVYGVVRDGNAVVDQGVAVSDLLPPEVVAAILAGDPPGAIVDGLDEWADDGLDPFDWVNGAPAGADPASALLDAFGDVIASEPEDGGSVEYLVATRIVTTDEVDLPEGCVVAAWGLLYPIEEQVIVRVNVIRQDATVAGEAEGTATPTPAAVPSATATVEADGVTSLPNTGAGDEARQDERWPLWLTLGAVLAVMVLAQCGGWDRRRRNS